MLRGSFLSCKDSFSIWQGEGRHAGTQGSKREMWAEEGARRLGNSPNAMWDIT